LGTSIAEVKKGIDSEGALGRDKKTERAVCLVQLSCASVINRVPVVLKIVEVTIDNSAIG